jgi:hypothetical protein
MGAMTKLSRFLLFAGVVAVSEALEASADAAAGKLPAWGDSRPAVHG